MNKSMALSFIFLAIFCAGVVRSAQPGRSAMRIQEHDKTQLPTVYVPPAISCITSIARHVIAPTSRARSRRPEGPDIPIS